jgi:hypothetical protein
MLEVVSAKYVDSFKVCVSFSNGESGVIDLFEALWGPVFEPLKEPEQFKNFEVSKVLHTISWPNGADFAPEFLYEKMVEQANAADS